MRLHPLIGLLFLLLSTAHAASPWADLYDLDTLPVLKTGVRTYQVASTDPTGGNDDWGHFQGAKGTTRVLADLKGPGIVRRIWSANPSGRLRIEIDGASKPAVDAPFVDIFQAGVPGFRPPVAGRSSGGWYSYVPISFTRSCRITVTDGQPFYYQVTWQSLPDADGLVPFSGRVDAVDEARALNAWSVLGSDPDARDAIALPEREFRLPPGGRWTQPVTGPGTITTLRFRFAEDTSFEAMRQAVLRISFDNQVAVEAPVADFFGLGFGPLPWKSLPMGYDERGAYSYFRMPFRKGARIEVINQGKGTFSASFSGKARAGVPSKPWGYFHANYHSDVNEAGKDYTIGRLRGAGHVVGVTQSMRGTGNLWFLEGDEKVFVDGEGKPSIQGTGAEDFFNCGWYFNDGPVNEAMHGLSHKAESEIGAWRFLIPDAVPFTRSLDFRIEHGGTNDAPGSEYASVIYWYGTIGSRYTGPPMLSGAALLPHPLIAPIPGAMEAEAARWTASSGGTVRRQPWQAISPYRGGGRILLKGKAGATATTPLEVRFTDSYDLDLWLSGADTSSGARILLDGSPLGPQLRDAPGPFPLRKVSAGPIRLTAGRHTLGLRLTDGAAIALDSFRLTPRSPLVTDFAVLGPFPVRGEMGVERTMPPDGEAPDLSRTYNVDGSPLRWRILQIPTGMLDLAANLSPNEHGVAFVAFAVKSPTERDVPLMLGSDDGVAAWVNGRRVWNNPVTRGFQLDQDRVPIRLNAGWNTVLLKVDQGVGDWAVSARIPDVDGVFQFAAIAPSSN